MRLVHNLFLQFKIENDNISISSEHFEVDNNQFIDESSQKSINKETDIKNQCSKCNKTFETDEELQNHSCKEKLKYPCEVCKKIFYRKGYLNNHKCSKDIHPPFCDICNTNFATKNNLMVHMRRHKSEKPFKCDFCYKYFVTVTEKKAHMVSVHTGQRNYVCDVCGKMFSSSTRLLDHRRRHFNEKRYKCSNCDKNFVNLTALKSHMFIHSESPRSLVCELCGATFRVRKYLTQHKLIHNKVKRYQCRWCLKRFSQHSGLYVHIKKYHDFK